MNKLLLLLTCLFTLHIHAVEAKKRVEIISYSSSLPYINDPIKDINRFKKIREKFDITFIHGITAYIKNFRSDDPLVHKYIFFDWCRDPLMKNMPKHKTICFKWEPFGQRLHWYDYYSRVYTYEDNLLDQKKFFKFYYPVLRQMTPNVIPFSEKKPCVMIASRWNKERLKMLDFFAYKPRDSLHVYGRLRGADQHANHSMYKGILTGYPTGDEKITTLSKYRFCICFENSHHLPGYVTEKIFDAFGAGCVPIYWGPENIETYIPKECFIDYRKFKSNEEMFQCITSMKEDEYQKYIDNIRLFLKSEKAKLFSVEQFEQTLTDAVFS